MLGKFNWALFQNQSQSNGGDNESQSLDACALLEENKQVRTFLNHYERNTVVLLKERK